MKLFSFSELGGATDSCYLVILSFDTREFMTILIGLEPGNVHMPCVMLPLLYSKIEIFPKKNFYFPRNFASKVRPH